MMELAPATAAKLAALRDLRPDWDSYGARPITDTALAGVVAWLTMHIDPAAIQPLIVPHPHGGIQLEWHRRGLDVEITFGADGAIHSWLVDAEGAQWQDMRDLAVHIVSVPAGPERD